MDLTTTYSVFAIFIIADLIVATMGRKKKMGYWGLFVICLLFSPLIGLIVAFVIPNLPDEEKISEGLQSSRIIADLANLKAIKDSGVLTDEEYKVKEDALKKVLLNPNVDADPKIKIKIKHNTTGSIDTVNVQKWNEMKLLNKDKDYTPILILESKTGGYQTVTIHEWNDIKSKGQQGNYKIYEGADIC